MRVTALTASGMHGAPAAVRAFNPAPDYGDLPRRLPAGARYPEPGAATGRCHGTADPGPWLLLEALAFCDVNLDYIARYEPARVEELVDTMEELVRETGQTGFHLVDEAAPPSCCATLRWPSWIEVSPSISGATSGSSVRSRPTWSSARGSGTHGGDRRARGGERPIARLMDKESRSTRPDGRRGLHRRGGAGPCVPDVRIDGPGNHRCDGGGAPVVRAGCWAAPSAPFRVDP